MSLTKYRQKRNFTKTAEPRVAARTRRGIKSRSFVVQEHHARRHHYDFCLELNGTLKSWAVPKGPSMDPSERRLAVHVEDHPLSYGKFEGTIPEGQYGAGTVSIWDAGTWEPTGEGTVTRAYQQGHLSFELRGKRLKGEWSLVRMGKGGEKENWLLIKKPDDLARRKHARGKRPESAE